MKPILYTEYSSPIGTLILTARDGALTGLWIQGERHAPELSASWQRDDDAFAEVIAQLDDYFAGRRWTFDLPVAPDGTEFQQRVWAELRRIPVHTTITYGELARRIGQPSAARAVGLANGRNPLSVVVPCHRVIGANRHLWGYGGGLEMKRFLLEHEGVPIGDDLRVEALSTGRAGSR